MILYQTCKPLSPLSLPLYIYFQKSPSYSYAKLCCGQKVGDEFLGWLKGERKML